ncbi:hypothetical protein ABPG74_001963 [Tetrahymena malaccensis]
MDGCEICQKNQIGFETCKKCLNTYSYFQQTNTCIKIQCEQGQFFILNSSNQEQCVSVCPNGFVKNYGNLTCQVGELCSLEYFQNSQLSNDRMAINSFFGEDGLILVFYGNLINVFNAENGSFVRQMQFESDIILIKYVNQNIYLLSDQNKVFIWDQVYQQSLLCSIIQNGVISASSDILLVKISFENQALILNSYIISFNNSYSFVISYLIENNQGQISLLQFNSQYTCFVNSNRIIYIEQIMINSEIALILLFENQQSIFIVKKDSNICEEINTSQQIFLKSQFIQSCETSATDCQQSYFIYALSQNNTIILIDLLQQNMISQWQFQQQIYDFVIIQSQKQDQIYLTLFNQQQIYIDSPVKLVYLIDNKGKNYLGVLSNQIQILDLSLNKSLFSSQFSEFEYYNSDQITQIAISDDKLFLASCDISGKVVVWYSIIAYQPKFLYQFQTMNEQCIQLLIFNSNTLIVQFQSYILLQNLYNQLMVTQIQMNGKSFSKILTSLNYIYLVYNLKIVIYTEQQVQVAEQIFDSDLQDTQISSYDEIFVVDCTNTIQNYQFNSQLMQVNKKGYAYNMVFSFDKMFLFNYPNQNTLIIVNDKNKQMSILNSHLDVLQKNKQQQGIVQDIAMLDLNLFFVLFQYQSQTFGFSCWIDFLEIQSDKIVQSLVARFSKLLNIQYVQKQISQFFQTHYYVLGLLPQSISLAAIGDWIQDTNVIKYSFNKQVQGGLVVKIIQDKQQTLSCAGTINGYFQCLPMNELDPTKKIYEIQQNQLSTDEIQFIKANFNHGAYYIIQKTKIQVFDLFTNQFIKLIQFEIDQQIPNAGEIILDFQVYENLGIFLTYNTKQIILQDIVNDKLYSISNNQFFIQGCLLDKNLQKIFFYGKTIMQVNLDLGDLQIKSPQNHQDFEICLFLEKVVICKLQTNTISIYDKLNSFKIIKMIQIQQILIGNSQIFVDEQNSQIFSYQNGILAYNFDGALLTNLDTQNKEIFQFEICSSYLIAYTPQIAYIISRQKLEIVQKIILSGQQFVKGFCFSSINLIAYSTNSLATGQFMVFSLATLKQKGVFKSSYTSNMVGNSVNIMYDTDNKMLFFLDIFGNCQLIQFDLQFVVKSQLLNEEIARQVNDPPIKNLIDFNMNEVFIHNRMNVWRFSYNYLTQNHYRVYENEFQYYILVSNQSDKKENSLLICDKKQNLFLYDQQQMTFIKSFQDNIIDMKKLKQSNQNIYIFVFKSYLNVIIGNTINILNDLETSYNITSVNITLQNIQFIQNEGNILVTQALNVIIEQSYFYQNQGINGACLSLQSLNIVQINNTHFIENNALASGGSIFCQDVVQLVTNQLTSFKNNSAQIGGAIRLSISNNQNILYLNQQNSIQAQFEGNIGQIYGNNIGKYPDKFKIFDSRYDALIEGKLFDYNSTNSVFSVTNIKSGDNFYLQISLYDDKGKILKIDQNKISNNTYHPSIVNELGQYIFEISDSSNQVDVRQQSIITYLQYNQTTLSFNFENIILAAYPNVTKNSTNLELKVVSWQTRLILTIQISFRNCKVGEAYQQISSQIIQCQKCSEGMYSVAEPLLNLQDLSQNECKKCPIGVDSCHSNVLLVSKGYWRENQQSDIIVKCNKNNPNICDSQNTQSIQGCIEGYIGPLCETCDIFGNIWINSFSSLQF